MEKSSFLFTPEGLGNIKQELEQLKNDRKNKTHPHLIDDDRDTFLEKRMGQLENLVACAKIIEKEEIQREVIQTGATVRLRDVEFDEEMEYRVVNCFEADPLKQKLSEASPIGRKLMTKSTGDRVTVEGPEGTLTYDILAVRY